MGLRLDAPHSLAWAALAAAAACATPGPPPSSAPPAFEGARSVALVRWKERTDRRPRDPLDALAESLAGLGIEVRILELGGSREAEGSLEVERLHAWAEARARSAPRGGPVREEALGGEAGEAVRRLGVDVAVLLHRFEDPLLPPLPDPARPADPFRRLDTALPAAPLGALTLVDRSGNAVRLAWGRPGAELEPHALVNAAEAVDAALRVLAGEPLDE